MSKTYRKAKKMCVSDARARARVVLFASVLTLACISSCTTVYAHGSSSTPMQRGQTRAKANIDRLLGLDQRLLGIDLMSVSPFAPTAPKVYDFEKDIGAIPSNHMGPDVINRTSGKVIIHSNYSNALQD